MTVDDHYRWPRYPADVAEHLIKFCEGDTFGSWNLGDIYDAVPDAFAQSLGSRFGVFTSTGTAALHAALIAAGVHRDDEVIVPSMTFIRSVTPLAHVGAVPVLADVDATTGNLSPDDVEANITERTRAVIAVHMWGLPCDTRALRRICDAAGVVLIEDFSQAVYTFDGNDYAGSVGHVGVASLQRKKLLSVGEGGVIITRDEELRDRLRLVTSPGSFPFAGTTDFGGNGLNMRMSPFGAVTVSALLPHVASYLQDRQAAVAAMERAANAVGVPLELMPERSPDWQVSWYAYKPRVSQEHRSRLEQCRLWRFSDFGYPPIATHPVWRRNQLYPFDLPVRLAMRTALPGHNEYLRDRITWAIPTVPSDYWTPDNELKWELDLQRATH